MKFSYDEAAALLARNDQRNLLRAWPSLTDSGRSALLDQIAGLDFETIAQMRKMLADRSAKAPPGDIEPASAASPGPGEAARALAAGAEALAAGRVGVILVAGGQGTRLGFNGPKGCFPIAPITGASLFEIHSRKILALRRRHGAPVPFYVMTSVENDRATRDFFSANSHFGLDPADVLFFTQGMWPALHPDGSLVMDRPDHIFMSPDGHGGVLDALSRNGMLDDMASRGVATLFYHQVDNPLVEIAAPAFVGAHLAAKADMSVKVCAKRDPEEGLGVVVKTGGRHAVVEYTELTDSQKRARLPDGALKFRLGSVAIHMFALSFLRERAAAAMPLHLAHKKAPFVGPDGKTTFPDRPNAFKFEKFIFDALPAAPNPLLVEFRREDEFSPVKNAEGNDSPATARRDMMRKFARQLRDAGIRVEVGADGDPARRVEIDPCFDPAAAGPFTAGAGGDLLLRGKP